MASSDTMVYSDGTTVEGSSHPQVDSGFGFTCDEEILPFIAAFYSVGMRTLGSCQCIPAWMPSVTVGQTLRSTPTVFPRRWVAYTHDSPQTVFDFAVHLRNSSLGAGAEWAQSVAVDRYSTTDTIFATLEFVHSLDAGVLAAIEAWGNKCR